MHATKESYEKAPTNPSGHCHPPYVSGAEQCRPENSPGCVRAALPRDFVSGCLGGRMLARVWPKAHFVVPCRYARFIMTYETRNRPLIARPAVPLRSPSGGDGHIRNTIDVDQRLSSAPPSPMKVPNPFLTKMIVSSVTPRGFRHLDIQIL